MNRIFRPGNKMDDLELGLRQQIGALRGTVARQAKCIAMLADALAVVAAQHPARDALLDLADAVRSELADSLPGTQSSGQQGESVPGQ